jgi:hypothetical protein
MCTSPTEAAADATARASTMPMPRNTEATFFCSRASKKNLFQRLTPRAAVRLASANARTPSVRNQARPLDEPVQNPLAMRKKERAM